MSKDINWLKERMNRRVTASNKEVALGYKLAVDKFNDLVSYIEQPESPAIPKYVVDYLKKDIPYSFEDKVKYLILSQTGDHYYLCDQLPCDGYLKQEEGERLYEWVLKQNVGTLLNLVNGYTVEKQKYYVIDNLGKPMLKKYPEGVSEVYGAMVAGSKWFESEGYEFTEQEIKDYDPRYWVFAIPVEEVEKDDKDE